MVIQHRSEMKRSRRLCFLSVALAATVIVNAVSSYSTSAPAMQAFLVVISLAALSAVVIAWAHLYSYPRRSHALIIQRENDMILATNAVHEGFKLRFLRDVLSENMFALSDADRERWQSLEKDGYHPVMAVRNVRKVLLLRLCGMMFDDVYAVDPTDRWEHYDCSNTPEPTSNKREMPPLTDWKGTANS